jgi:molecular chaperone GrpE
MDTDAGQNGREHAAPNAPEATPPQPEEAERGSSQGADASEVEALRAELEATRKRLNDLAWAVKHGEKEREDFKARLQREREQLLDVERGKVATALLDTVDELDLCLRAAPSDDPLARGVRMIREGILNRLSQTGVQRIEVVGQTFDPNTHEAADMEVTGVEADDQKVVAEVRAGYRLKERLIRPARVKVARYMKPADA